MKKIGFLVLAVLYVVTIEAQQLKRKGALGVGLLNNISDSIKVKFDYESGAMVSQVFPNSTAEKVGILINDIITKANNTNISNSADLVNFAKTVRNGDEIIFHLKRNKTPLTFKGNVLPRPMEQSTNTMDVVYGDFKYKNGLVRTFYKSPKGKTPKSYIYFLQGLPCYSLDNMQPLDKTKQAIDKLVELGHAVYYIEKGDMGDNENCPPCATMGFNVELEMYDVGYQNFLSLKDVVKEKTFLFGHSMGGTTAPLLAAKHQPKGVVVYGTNFKPWSDYLVDAYLIQSQYKGYDLGDLRENIEKFKPYLNQFFYTDKSADEIIAEPMGRATLQNLLSYQGNGKSGFGRHISAFKELNQHNVAKGFSNFNNYTLAIYGECDLNANSPSDNIDLVKHVNAIRPGHGTFWLAPKSSHSFEEIGTMQEFLELWADPRAYGQYAAPRFNGKIFEYVNDWIDSTLIKKSTNLEPAYFKDLSDFLPEPGAMRASMDVKAVDVDKDGDLDIILANEFQANSILINDGKGIFYDESVKRLPQVIHDSEDIVSQDMDGDGDIDIIFCSEDDKIHEFYLNDGKGFYTAASYQFSPSEANAVISGDINKDGKPDVIFGNNGQNQIYINQGSGTFKLEEARLPVINKVTQDIALVDIDKDGDLDLIEANEDGNILYQNDGKGFFKDLTSTHFVSDAKVESRKIASHDVDGDGDIDLFFANVNFRGEQNPQNLLYINDGKGKFKDESVARVPVDDDHSIDAIFEDIDGDGDHDIVVANVFGGKIKVYLNDGKGFFTLGSDKLLGGKIEIDALGVISADINGDGKRDLYFCDRYNLQANNKDVMLVRE